MSWLAMLLFLLILLVMNGLFVAGEYAVVKMRRSRVQELVNDGHRLASVIQGLQGKMSTTIAGTQLGITLCSLAMGWVGDRLVVQVADALRLNISGWTGIYFSMSVTLAMCFMLLSVLHVIIGEQVPKSMALRLPENVAMVLCVPIRFFCSVAYPLLWVMSGLAGLVLKCLGVPDEKENQLPVHSAEELEILLENNQKAGTLQPHETDIMKRALDLKERKIQEVMVPAAKMHCVKEGQSLRAVVAAIAKHRHSKMPVYQSTGGGITGILNAKALLMQLAVKPVPEFSRTSGSADSFQLSDFMSEPCYALESQPVSELMETMLSNKIHMAIVKNEQGAITGLVTMKDLLEELVGEIHDQDDL